MDNRFRLCFGVSLVLLTSGFSPLPAAELPTVTGDVTFSKDIAPILQRSCQNCHQPNSVAPMSLITYTQARPWAKSIKERTLLRDKRGAMPPRPECPRPNHPRNRIRRGQISLLLDDVVRDGRPQREFLLLSFE